jgi:hypothetical protein
MEPNYSLPVPWSLELYIGVMNKMEVELSQGPATGPYPEPDKLSP